MALRSDECWAYNVAIASCLLIFIGTVVDKSPGIFYPYMIDYFEESAKKVALALSFIPALKKILGPLAAILTEKISCQQVTIFSSVTMMSGSLLIYFSTSFNQLLIACVLIGYGISLAYFSSYYILDVYFQSHFTLVFSILTLARGIGSTVATPLNQFIVMRYGWKSSYLILTAIFYQISGCAAVFRTPKNAQTHEKNDKEMKLIELKPLQNTKTSLKEKLDYIYQLGHFTLFNNSIFLLLLFALFLQGTVNEGIVLIMTDDLNDRGATLHASQTIGTFYGLGSVFGAPFHYVCSKFISKNLLVHYAMCLFTASLSFFVCIVFNAEFALYITAFVYGFTNGWETALKPLIIKYYVDYDDFAFGFAWVNFSYGISAFVGSPIIGFLRGATGTYWASELLLLVFTTVGTFTILFTVICQKK